MVEYQIAEDDEVEPCLGFGGSWKQVQMRE